MDELAIVHLITAFSFILVGVLSVVIKPEKPNKLMGYRTKRSMKSIEAWRFSNDKFAVLMLWNSLVAITIQVFTYFTMDGVTSILLTTAVFTIGLGVCFILVEKGLSEQFKKDGDP